MQTVSIVQVMKRNNRRRLVEDYFVEQGWIARDAVLPDAPDDGRMVWTFPSGATVTIGSRRGNEGERHN